MNWAVNLLKTRLTLKMDNYVKLTFKYGWDDTDEVETHRASSRIEIKL